MSDSANNVLLSSRGLQVFYGQSHVLRGVCLDVPERSCVCLLGRNGVGKTTLLKAMMGLLPVREGSISFAGESLTAAPVHRRARLGIGYVPQGRYIFPDLSVEENLLAGRMWFRLKRTVVPARVFELFPMLWEMKKRRAGDLSGGQQQQLAIGRALALEPKLLILDEPTEGIQPSIVEHITEAILRLNREHGIALLVVEQKLDLIRRVAKSFCIMERGGSVASGSIEALDDGLSRRYLAV